ncbi:MAG: serine/threonine-protein kinase [Thermoanaerobaculia bacterium]
MDDGTRTIEAGLRSHHGAEAHEVRLFAPGTALGARFEIGAVRGVGGSAVVYSAFDRELKQAVALKVLRADRTSPAALLRMKREVAIARQAASPRLVRVYDIDASGESVFLTMEDVPGGSLKERLEEGPLPVEEALRVAGEILEGLAVLHALGIVHRDVKPGNVLLAADGSVKLADFGLARRLEVAETRATSMDAVVGTIDYLSPEQALGRELDGRSDLYSFGVTLYEMLTGGVPFRRDSAVGTALAHVRDPAPRLRAVRPELPAWLDAYVARLLVKQPEERYATAEAALADLRAQRGTPPPVGVRRRRRVVLGALAAIGVVLVAVAAALAGARLRRPEVVRFGPHANGLGVVALDGSGRALWELPDLPNGSAVRMFRRPRGRTGVAAVRSVAPGASEVGATIALLDPASGAVRKEIRISVLGPLGFWDLPERWVFGALEPVDADGREGEELVLTLVHPELYPSATFLVDPETGTSRFLLAESGHSRFLGAVDVDGDGRKELLLGSPGNRLGRYVTVAAVRPTERHPVSGSSDQTTPLPPTSPDLPPFERHLARLAWYALGPASLAGVSRSMTVDHGRRTFRVTGLSAEPFEIGFDGFDTGSRTPLGPGARQEARAAAWLLLQRAARLEQEGSPAAAAEAAAEAAAAISPAGDRSLLEWARRCEARLTVAAGRIEEGERRFREIARDPVATIAVAYDAARALHLAGSPTRSIPWYRHAVLGDGSVEELWLVADALADAVFAHSEVRRFDEALSLLEAVPGLSWSHRQELRALALWRAGRPVPPPSGVLPATSLRRAWLLEERLATGADRDSLLAETVAERRRGSGADELLALLEAELHLRGGRAREAWNAASPAFAALWEKRSRDVTARGHLALAADRTARAAEAAGARPDALRIRSDVGRFLAAAR